MARWTPRANLYDGGEHWHVFERKPAGGARDAIDRLEADKVIAIERGSASARGRGGAVPGRRPVLGRAGRGWWTRQRSAAGGEGGGALRAMSRRRGVLVTSEAIEVRLPRSVARRRSETGERGSSVAMRCGGRLGMRWCSRRSSRRAVVMVSSRSGGGWRRASGSTLRGQGTRRRGQGLGLGLLAYVVSWWVGRSVRVGGSSCPDTSMVRGRTARSTYGAIRACDVGCRGIARGPSTLLTVRASRGRSGAPGGLLGGQFDRAVVSPPWC